MIDGHLHINGQPVKREQIERLRPSRQAVRQWRETLPNGATHRTLDLIENGFYDNTQVYTVPDGHYFMMGDNRDNAADSRSKCAWGPCPRENLIGRVIFCVRSSCRLDIN